MGFFDNAGDGPLTFSAYSFDAVKTVFTDNATFSTRIYEAIAFARPSMRRWETELVGPLVEGTIDKLRRVKRADLVAAVFMPIPVRIIAALLGLPEAYVPEFHRLGIDPLGFRAGRSRSRRCAAFR